MLSRIVIGSLIIAAIFALVGVDAGIARSAPLGSAMLARGSLIPLTLAVLAALGAMELVTLLRRAGLAPYEYWAITCSVALVLAPWLGPTGVLGATLRVSAHAQLVVFVVALLGTGGIAVLRRDVTGGMLNMATTCLAFTYTGLLPSFLTHLRCDLPGEHGAWIVLTIVLICKSTDIGAYFVGSVIGRHKLIPSVSPKKSVEGLLGGIAASCAVSLLFWYLRQAAQEAAKAAETSGFWAMMHERVAAVTVLFDRLTFSQTMIFAIVTAIVGQVGDLVESIFKRSANAKDSAALLPGFGGILDMIDSPIAVAPVAWFLLTTVWAVM